MSVPAVLIALIVALSADGLPPPSGQATSPDPGLGDGEMVVLVHGMGRTPLSMLPLEWALEAEGYRVLNWGYSSVCCGIAELGGRLERDLAALEEPLPARIHFVGHSLGSAIIRWVLTRPDLPWTAGHAVFLAPPSQGSSEADRFTPYLGWLLTPMSELRTDSSGTVRSLPRVEGVRIGVVAGRFDGKVREEETHLPEQAEHVTVPATHSFLMLRRDVQRLVLGFLREGSFEDGVRPDDPVHPATAPATR